MARPTYYARKALRGDDDIMVAAGDVETDGLGGKLLMVQWGFMGEVFTDSSPNMIENFFNFLLNVPRPAIFYFHFGQYDWRYFLDYIIEAELEVNIGMRTDTDVYQISVRRPGTKSWSVIRDSYALWNSTLEKLANSFCPEIPKLEIDIENFDPHNPKHIEYAKRDVMILLVGLPRLFDMLHKHFGVNAGATTAGTALKAWQYTLDYETIYNASQYDEREEFIRQAYYGGLVFLTTNEMVKDAETFDINSSYPASMEKYGVPGGRVIETKEYSDEYMGIYRCRVKAPDNLIVPILPARDERGSMRWYAGEFETVCTNRELTFAVKQGYEVLEIFEGIIFEETLFPFSDFVTKCRHIRLAFKGAPEEMLAKLMQNSVYGKFGARRERTRMMSSRSMGEDEFLGSVPYDADGNWYIAKEFDDEMLCNPAWAVFITAHSRLRLLQTVYSVGPENCLYGDTDSLTVRPGHSDNIDVGDEYGQFKLEKKWKYFRPIAPKVYAGVLDDGTFTGAAKGLPRKGITDRNWIQLMETGHSEATALSLDSLRVAMKKGVKSARELTRVSSKLENSSNFQLLTDNRVRVKLKS